MANGLVEVSGRVWKRAFEKTVEKQQISDKDRHLTVLAFTGTNRAHNSRARHAGFSPLQWVLGRNLPLPSSLTANTHNLAAQETSAHPESPFHRRLQLLGDCDVSWVEADNDGRVRKAVLGRMRPMRGPFCGGAQIYVGRKRGALGQAPGKTWVGPCVVICEDGDNVWRSSGRHLIKTAKELCRHASEDELRACQLVASELSLCSKQLADGQRPHAFLDLTDEETNVPDDLCQNVSVEAAAAEGHSHATEGSPLVVQQGSVAHDEVGDGLGLCPGPSGPPAPTGPPPVTMSPPLPTGPPVGPPSRVEQPPLDQDVEGETGGLLGGEHAGESITHTGRTGNATGVKRHISFTPGLGLESVARQKRRGSPVSIRKQPAVNKSRQNPPEDTKQRETFFSNRVEIREREEHQEHELGCFLGERIRFVGQKEWGKYQRRHKTVGLPAQCLLAQKKKGSGELHLKDMPRQMQDQFREAMAKEWEGWLALNACEVIAPHQARNISRSKCIPCRFVLTDKNEMLRCSDHATDELPVLPKARLVALGNLDRKIAGHRTDAPTLSEVATHLTYQRAASWGTDLIQGDVKQAFLNGVHLGRDIYLHLPKEGLPGVAPGSLLKVCTPVYGMADAPRAWWLKFKQILEKVGWEGSRLDRALFYLKDERGDVCGQGGPHVDDFVCTGRGPVYEKALETMKQSVKWGSWKVNEFTHCGRGISREKDGSVLVEQHTYIQKLKPIILETKLVGEPLSPKEMEEARGLLGGLGWAAKQTRPDACYGVSTLLSEISGKDRSVAKRANALLGRIQDEQVTLRFPAQLDYDSAMLVVFTDASFANRADGFSQGGVIHALMNSNCLQGSESPIAFLEWSSHRVERVCRSTLSAEGQMVSAGLEGGDFLKVLLREGRGAGFRLSRYTQYLKDTPGAIVMDARSVFDFLSSDSGKLPTDRRLALDLRLVQHYITASDWALRWVSGPQQLSDSLTKETGDTRYLFWVMRNSKYQLLRDTHLENKVKQELSEAEKRVREEETPEERQRRRNRQKGANHRRRDQEVEKIVFGLNSAPRTWEAKLAQHVRRRTVLSAWMRNGLNYAVRQGLRALSKATTESAA